MITAPSKTDAVPRSVLVIVFAALVMCWGHEAMAQQLSSDSSSQQCLERLWASAKASSSDRAFDLEFDRTLDGTSYACDLSIRASEARSAIEEFKLAVMTRSPEHLRRSVVFPLEVTFHTTRTSSDAGERVLVAAAEEWQIKVDRRVSNQQRASIACANVSTATIIKGSTYGFSVAGDVLFLPITAQRGAPPAIKVVRIALYPVSDAAVVIDCARHVASTP